MEKNINKKMIFSFSIIILVLFVFFIGYLLDDGVRGNVDAPTFAVTGTVEAKEVDVASKVPGKIVQLL
ncbi:MAG: hypothetical protein GXW85_07475, partial [Clostridia bacterium]|nr:hypothetical protein [Clostridia bacterium]